MSKELEKEIVKLNAKFEEYEKKIEALTLENTRLAKDKDEDNITRLSQREIAKSPDIYVKPKKTLMAVGEKFNEKYREEYNYKKQYVRVIAEHRECPGDTIEIWTKRFAGTPAEFWEIPTGKPVFIPRYVAEELADRKYNKIKMDGDSRDDRNRSGSYGEIEQYGMPTVEEKIKRITAYSASTNATIFT